MSQSPDTDTLILASSEPSEPDAVTLVDVYADHLMDDLFGDVDRLLDGDAAPGQVSSTIVLPLDNSLGDDTLVTTAGSLEPLSPVAEAGQLSTESRVNAPAPKRWSRIFSRLLFLVAASSAIGVGGLWALSEYRLNQADLATVPGDAVALTGQAQPKAEFLNYLQRSLEVIANKATAAEAEPAGNLSTVAVMPGSPLVVPPTPTGLAALPGSLSRPQVNVIERVYIPYQPAQTPVAAAPSAATRTAPVASPGQPQVAAIAPNHALVGVLELGTRSAALFEIDGVPQRVYMGERIGSSGWSLVSVSNQEAVIRRNGEVRSIYIGQKF